VSAAGNRVAVVCDVGSRIGVGHAMRCLALSEELLRRGCTVSFVCDAHEVSWVADRIRSLGVGLTPAPEAVSLLPSVLAGQGADTVVFDSYRLPTSVYDEVRATATTMAFVDGETRGAVADLLLDQNFGASAEQLGDTGGARVLAGIEFAVLRDDVLARRPDSAPRARGADVPQVLAFFGGTDAFGVGPYVARALARTERPFDATFVAPSTALRERIQAVSLHPGQSIAVSGPTSGLSELIASADVVVCAAGTSMWEVFALGACVGLVCVADNQELAYEAVIDRGVGMGVGRLDQIRRDVSAPVPVLRRLLEDEGLRSRLAETAWGMVDGRGKQRVVDALLSLTSPSRPAPSTS